MKWTGKQDANHYELQNLIVEKVSASPSHDPSDEGRLVYNTTSKALELATDTAYGSVGGGGGGVPGYSVTFVFSGALIDASTPFPLPISILNGIAVGRGKFTGQLVASYIETNPSGPIGQSISIQPIINGTPLGASGLDLTISDLSSNNKYDHKKVSYPDSNYTVFDVADQELAMLITGDALNNFQLLDYIGHLVVFVPL